MTTTTGKNGRLGNQIIRNLAVSLLAEKHNLNVNYYNKDLIHKLGIQLFCGSCSYNKIQRLTDDNYFLIYNMDTIHYNLDPNNNYFQTKDISVFLHNYLHKIQSSIIAKNPFKERYNNNNDLCIHIRLTDVAHFNPGISYYRKAIQPIKFDNLYICTDDPNNPMIVELLKRINMIKPYTIVITHHKLKPTDSVMYRKELFETINAFTYKYEFLVHSNGDVRITKYLRLRYTDNLGRFEDSYIPMNTLT